MNSTNPEPITSQQTLMGFEGEVRPLREWSSVIGIPIEKLLLVSQHTEKKHAELFQFFQVFGVFYPSIWSFDTVQDMIAEKCRIKVKVKGDKGKESNTNKNHVENEKRSA